MNNYKMSFSQRIQECIDKIQMKFSINNNRRIEDLLNELLILLDMKKAYHRVIRFNDNNIFELLIKNYRIVITPTTVREVNIYVTDEDSGKEVIDFNCKLIDMQEKILDLTGLGLSYEDDTNEDDLSIENAIKKFKEENNIDDSEDSDSGDNNDIHGEKHELNDNKDDKKSTMKVKNYRDDSFDDYDDNYQHVEKIKKHKKRSDDRAELDFSDRKWNKTKYNYARRIKNHNRFDDED